MNVEDVMTPRGDVVTVELPGTRDDCLEYLQDRAFSSVPVVKPTDSGDEFRGIVTRDALIEQPDEDQLALLVEEVTTVEPGTSLQDVAALMVEKHERRVPVVANGDERSLEGIVTVTDLIHAIAHGDVPADVEVGAVANTTINTVHEDVPLPVAERQLYFAGVPYAVVLGDDGKQVGMLTVVDVLDVARVVEGETDTGESIANQDSEWAWEGIKAVGNRYMPTRNVEIPTGPVSDFMTPDLVTISRNRSVQEAAQLMVEHDIEQIPLVSGDELVGLVQDIHLLEALR